MFHQLHFVTIGHPFPLGFHVQRLLNVHRIRAGNVHRVRFGHLYGHFVKHGNFDRQRVRKGTIHLHRDRFLDVDGDFPLDHDRNLLLDRNGEGDLHRNGHVAFDLDRVGHGDVLRDGDLLEELVAVLVVGFRMVGIEQVGRFQLFAGAMWQLPFAVFGRVCHGLRRLFDHHCGTPTENQ